VNRALDLVESLPKATLLWTAAGAAVVALLLAAILGGNGAVIVLLLGACAVLGAGGLLALRVHLGRLPLALAHQAVEGRVDGHRAIRFRVRLGRGRRMDRVEGMVRFVPSQGSPVELPLLLPCAEQVVGPFTLVAVDRTDALPGGPGSFHVRVTAREGEREHSAEREYAADLVVAGRFRPALALRRGRVVVDHEAWSRVDREGAGGAD